MLARMVIPRLSFLDFICARFGKYWTTDPEQRRDGIRFITQQEYALATMDWKAGRDP